MSDDALQCVPEFNWLCHGLAARFGLDMAVISEGGPGETLHPSGAVRIAFSTGDYGTRLDVRAERLHDGWVRCWARPLRGEVPQRTALGERCCLAYYLSEQDYEDAAEFEAVKRRILTEAGDFLAGLRDKVSPPAMGWVGGQRMICPHCGMDTEKRSAVGRRLAAQRLALGRRQKEIAALAGVTCATISATERGLLPPSAKVLSAYLRVGVRP